MSDATNLSKLKGIKIEDYSYDLPDCKIAKFPLSDRSASKLLVYDGNRISETVFSKVPSLLESGQTLVFNTTKVIYARLFFHKPTGAQIEVFCLEPVSPADYAMNFSSVGSCEWICMVGNLKKWHDETLAVRFAHESDEVTLSAEKVGLRNGEVRVRFSWDKPISFSEVLEICGKLPIPPYLNRPSEESDKIRYQTVYSREEGSVAAPTAGLHFTKEILTILKGQGIRLENLTLHVGAGTFRPVKSEHIGDHEMHTEHIVVSKKLVDGILQAPQDIIAVGTTSVRTLESLYWMGVKRLMGDKDFYSLSQWEAYTLPAHHSMHEALTALSGWFEESGEEMLKARTTIIIVPGYRFRVIDGMFTNFHQPQSTLLLLVGAAVGEDWHKIYDYALSHGFRFLSYGDSSLLKIINKEKR